MKLNHPNLKAGGKTDELPLPKKLFRNLNNNGEIRNLKTLVEMGSSELPSEKDTSKTSTSLAYF